MAINRHQAASLNDFYDAWGAIKIQAKREEVDGGVSTKTQRDKDRLDDYAMLMTGIRAVEKRDLKGRRSFVNEPYLVGLAREALGRAPLENNPSPFTAENLPAEIKKVVQKFAKRKAETVILSYGEPMDVHEGDESNEESLAKWEAKHAESNAFLGRHKESPLVQKAIQDVLRSDSFMRVRKGEGQPQPPDWRQYTSAEKFQKALNAYPRREERWWRRRDRAMEWMGAE